jgi:peptidoglycan/LPS O-acetylase OafA/YrhL
MLIPASQRGPKPYKSHEKAWLAAGAMLSVLLVAGAYLSLCAWGPATVAISASWPVIVTVLCIAGLGGFHNWSELREAVAKARSIASAPQAEQQYDGPPGPPSPPRTPGLRVG